MPWLGLQLKVIFKNGGSRKVLAVELGLSQQNTPSPLGGEGQQNDLIAPTYGLYLDLPL